MQTHAPKHFAEPQRRNRRVSELVWLEDAMSDDEDEALDPVKAFDAFLEETLLDDVILASSHVQERAGSVVISAKFGVQLSNILTNIAQILTKLPLPHRVRSRRKHRSVEAAW